ncbi:MAG: hypothetical protein AAFN94_13035 [Pseudomonadota bacterium]
MATGSFSSPLLRDLFPTGTVGQLWTDSAEVRAMLIVLGALAKVQGTQGAIPEDSAAFIHRSSLEVQIDPAGLSGQTAQEFDPVPALVTAFQRAMEAPEHARHAMHDTPAQHIADTALMLRLRQTLSALEERAQGLNAAVAAHVAGLPLLRDTALVVAAPAPVRAPMAEALKLGDPGQDWVEDRGPVDQIAAWLATLTHLAGADAAGHPVLTALSTQMNALQAMLAAPAASPLVERMALPQIALTAACAVETAKGAAP